MNIIISGYGRMGKEVEKICLKRNHKVIAIIDNDNEWHRLNGIDYSKTVVIDFSLPYEAINIFNVCFKLGLPIVTGTTGWYDEMEKVKKLCIENNGTFLYAPNFSIGVNIFFRTNQYLAKLMLGADNYKVHINETHHIHKIDAPSGTSIATAEGIISNNHNLLHWKLNDEAEKSIPIYSIREGEVTGKHDVIYQSDVDSITLIHEAKNRGGFALGAVLAAEFIHNRKGFFTMNDLLDQLI
ncbi:MAG: 4-hydroxy-tetrahydrodipicolinate reductase [Bacteroidetes bacterium]|nr:4-hydroxy-tetrahydrodipicolinate reductase [Bacteroidota bacterium]